MGVRQPHEPHSAEVQGARDLSERGGHAGKCEGGEEAEVQRVGGADGGEVVVSLAGDGGGGGVVAGGEMRAGGGDAEDGEGDVVLLHHGDVGFGGPDGDGGHAVGVGVPVVDEMLAVAGREGMAVHVDALHGDDGMGMVGLGLLVVMRRAV